MSMEKIWKKNHPDVLYPDVGVNRKEKIKALQATLSLHSLKCYYKLVFRWRQWLALATYQLRIRNIIRVQVATHNIPPAGIALLYPAHLQHTSAIATILVAIV